MRAVPSARKLLSAGIRPNAQVRLFQLQTPDKGEKTVEADLPLFSLRWFSVMARHPILIILISFEYLLLHVLNVKQITWKMQTCAHNYHMCSVACPYLVTTYVTHVT